MNPWSNKSFPWCKQYDSMQCGVACLVMISEYYGSKYTRNELEEICHATNQGISMYGIAVSAEKIGLRTFSAIAEIHELYDINKPTILHWDQNHFVILYKITKDDNLFFIADPRKGLVRYSYEEFKKHWVSTNYEGKDAGTIMILEPTKKFYRQSKEKVKERKSFHFLIKYIIEYRKFLLQILLGLLLVCVLQLIMPFLTQAIVDIGIKYNDIGFIWLVLLGELMIVTGRTTTDFIRRWLLLHVSMRINISLVSDFFFKLLKLPMSFFETKMVLP